MSIYGVVLKDDKFENAIRKRINNMNTDYARYLRYNTSAEYGELWHYYNPLNNIWQMRINLCFEYINKKIDEKYEVEVRRLMS